MPKTYILRKPLPDAPVGTKLFFQDGRYYYKSNTEMDSWYHKMVVENMPEWFEEDQPAPWEIVAYKGKYLGFNGVIFIRDYGDVFRALNYPQVAGHRELRESLVKGGMYIFQVKRRSDGVIFTLGDNTNVGLIGGFSIEYGEMVALFKTRLGIERKYIEELQKVTNVSADNKDEGQKKDDSVLTYVRDMKNKSVREGNFDEAERWRAIERYYSEELSRDLREKEKPRGAFVDLHELAKEILSDLRAKQRGAGSVGFDPFKKLKYKSPYPAEVAYTCDKNFVVRLQAFIDRIMYEAGYDTVSDDQKRSTLVEQLKWAEDSLFASKKKNDENKIQ